MLHREVINHLFLILGFFSTFIVQNRTDSNHNIPKRWGKP